MSDDARKTDDVELRCPGGVHRWTFASPRHVTLVQWHALFEQQKCPECGASVLLRTGDYTKPGVKLKPYPTTEDVP